jgi:hypothetical protein
MKRKLSTSHHSDSSEGSDVEQEPKGGKRKRSTKASQPPKKKAKKDSFIWSSAPPSRSNAYHIALDDDIFQTVQERKAQVETPNPLSVEALGFEGTLHNIYQFGKNIEGNTNISTKQQAIEGGRMVFEQDGVPILVRFDKTKADQITTHVSIDGSPSKSTNSLSGLMQKYTEQEDEDAFLRGLKGEELEAADYEIGSETEWNAYQDGTEARWALMLDGFMGSPGSSVLVENKLDQVDSPEDYSALFKKSKTTTSKKEKSAIQARKKYVEKTAALDIEAIGLEKTLNSIYHYGKNILDNMNITAGKNPIEGGRIIIQQGDVNILVRLDKTKTPTVNARVSINTLPDKSTKDLANLMQKYTEQEDIDAFLRGLKGEDYGDATDETDGDETDAEHKKNAYQDGTEARWVLLLSDIMDNPGSSTLVEQMLQRVTSHRDYLVLFISGEHNEYSYGAIPSQNQFTGLDKNSNEYKLPFVALRELLNKGKISVTDTVSNQPVFRKLKVMREFMPPGLLKLQSQKKGEKKIEDVSHQQARALFADVQKKAARTRNQISSEQAERYTFVQSDDEDSDEEDKKLTYFTTEEKQERAQRTQRNLEIAQTKARAQVRASGGAANQDLALMALKLDTNKFKELTPEEAETLKVLFEKLQKQ